jgi:hypothetical protein
MNELMRSGKKVPSEEAIEQLKEKRCFSTSAKSTKEREAEESKRSNQTGSRLNDKEAQEKECKVKVTASGSEGRVCNRTIEKKEKEIVT